MTNTKQPTVRSLPTDARVGWKPGHQPIACPHALGRVFTSQGRTTFVIWDGETKPVAVFTGALAKIR